MRGAPLLPSLVHANTTLTDDDVSAFDNLPALETIEGTLKLSHWSSLSRLKGLKQIRPQYIQDVSTTDGAPQGLVITPVSRHESSGLSLYAAETLRSVRDLNHVSGFDRLWVVNCVHLESLDGLQGMPLISLDLRGCVNLRDVSALEQVPTLRVIAARGCPLADESFPEAHRWAITRAADPDMDALSRRSPTVAKAKVEKSLSGVDPNAWAEFMRLASEGKVDEAAAVASKAGKALYDRVLKGARYDEEAGELRSSGWPIAGAARQRLLHRIVTEAPSDCAIAKKIRNGVTKLTLDALTGHTKGRWSAKPSLLDLAPLDAFPHLREVRIDNMGKVKNLDVLAKCKKLDKLQIFAHSSAEPLVDLAFLSGSPVTQLQLGAKLGSLVGLSSTHITTLDTGYGVQSRVELKGVGDCPLLTKLTGVLFSDPADLRHFPSLKTLEFLLDGVECPPLVHTTIESLSMRGHEAVGDLTGLSSLRALALQYPKTALGRVGRLPSTLESLTLGDLAPDPVFANLNELEALTKLQLNSKVEQLKWASAIPHLQTLELPSFQRLPSIAPLFDLKITSLRVYDAADLPDIESLASHPTLRVVECRKNAHILPERLRSPTP
jgi:hypothetical protein